VRIPELQIAYPYDCQIIKNWRILGINIRGAITKGKVSARDCAAGNLPVVVMKEFGGACRPQATHPSDIPSGFYAIYAQQDGPVVDQGFNVLLRIKIPLEDGHVSVNEAAILHSKL